MSDVVCKIIRDMGAAAAIKSAKVVMKKKLVPEKASVQFYARLGALDDDLIAGYTEAFDWLGAARMALAAGEEIPPPPWE